MSAAIGWNNTSLSSTEDLPSKAEGIAWCSAFALEAVLIVAGNLLTIVLFVVNKNLRKKSLFLVINMAFADLMLGAVYLPARIFVFGVVRYQLWTKSVGMSFYAIFFPTVEIVFLQGSLFSAATISAERFYAIYWPLKHRTLSMRAYRIDIFMTWVQAILLAGMIVLIVSIKLRIYVLMSYFLSLLFVVCGCNIGIWRKFQHHGSIASHQQNRGSQNQRLTKTLLFVSILALLSWLPIIIVNYLRFHSEIRSLSIFDITDFLCYCNSFVNPIVYALRIPEFRQALGSCWFRKRAAMNREVNRERRDNRAAALPPVMQLRTLPTDPNQLVCEQKAFQDTRL